MTNNYGRTHPFQAVAPTENLSEVSAPGWACMLSPNLWVGRANKKLPLFDLFMPHRSGPLNSRCSDEAMALL